MSGWNSKLLRVNLTTGESSYEELDTSIAGKFLGGRGLGVKILFDEIDPSIEALSAENKLIFTTGPLVGTLVPTGNGCTITTKSPLTGAIATGRFGGEFGAELKYTGYEAIIIEGKAPNPVYLSIEDNNVEIKSAEHLWGKNTVETDALLKEKYRDRWKAGDVHIACIGPAGERLVRVASVMSDKHHAAARSGIGAVMGFKNLKAIMVRGTKDVSVADEVKFHEAVMTFLAAIQESPILTQSMAKFGTLDAQFFGNKKNALGTTNFKASYFEGVNKTNARALQANFLRMGISCFACPVPCIRSTQVNDPEFKGQGAGPEFETCQLLGPDCGVDNLAAIVKANYLCNELGMDSISVGGTIACAMEMFESGYFTEKETGCQLKFGNARALVQMVEKMGLREGFGDELAEGGYRMAEKFGHPECFMGSKKQEFPAWHAQVLQGVGLEYATSNSGASHQRAGMFNFEVFGRPYAMDPAATQGKAAVCIDRQHSKALYDSTGLCAQLRLGKTESVLPMLLSAATGLEYTSENLASTGERVWNLERLFNLRAGLTGKDDTLPKRIVEQPMTEGPNKGQVNRLAEMLPEYYRLRGWDENGVPTPEKLAELELP